MTDGIIQKVFKKARKEHPQVFAHSVWFNDVEQELIKEIKKGYQYPLTWYLPHKGNYHRIYLTISQREQILKELVGDNE